jgi:riboflavin kinase / FMN adenylyltransferase
VRREIGYEHVRRDPHSVVTVGTFDGVHRGHQEILRYLRQRAEQVGGSATVVSFDPHPREVVQGEAVPLLSTLDERATLIAAEGVDRFVVLPFTRDLSMLEPEAYVRDVLVETVGMREIVIGYDHAFGRNRTGTRTTLEEMGPRYGFTVDVIPEQMVQEATVSSSRVRSLLLEGNVAESRLLLGRPYAMTGSVSRGDQRGRTIGFPTANLRLPPRKLIPRGGVYAVRASISGDLFGGMMNIGTRPTFGADEVPGTEVHLFDFDRDVYGLDITVYLLDRIRDEQRFSGITELAAQLRRDERASRAILDSAPGPN